MKSPNNTTWAYIRLTELCNVTKPETPVYNWVHHTDDDLVGHIKLESKKAWEIITEVATKEQQASRIERNRSSAHETNLLRPPDMQRKTLKVAKTQPEPSKDDAGELTTLAKEYPGILKAGDIGELQVIDLSADSNNFQPDPLFGINLEKRVGADRHAMGSSNHSKSSYQTVGDTLCEDSMAVLLVNLQQNIGLGKNQNIGDIGCFPVQI